MGLDRKVVFAPEKAPTWTAFVNHLAAKKLPIQLRMMDGQLAFPEEQPLDSWKELRISIGGGMMTLVREPDGVRLVIWGNADPELQEAWRQVAACLEELTA